jgi:uncharacterized MAPEG superfamily protein
MTPAYWCVFLAALMPYGFIVLARFPFLNRGPRAYDNRRPREHVEKLEGWRKRADAAHLNSFEAFPPFAAAVIIAHSAGAPERRITALAIAFIACRLLYGVCYLGNVSWLRSLLWIAGLSCVAGLFVVAV